MRGHSNTVNIIMDMASLQCNCWQIEQHYDSYPQNSKDKNTYIKMRWIVKAASTLI